MYIVTGLFLIGECIADFLEFQKILNDVFWIKVILFGAIILMVIVYFIVASKCKKMTDNE
jgi:phage shock protein PspC (stress-responsive transcriptional regulator)